MTEPNTTKTELLAAIEREWEALQTAVSHLTPEQMTAIQDEQGWTVRDHLVHLAAWERSVLFMLHGQPRHEGLGVAESLYLSGDFEAINAAIWAQNQDVSLAVARRRLQAVHQQLLAAIAPLDDAALQKPYAYYLPQEPGGGDGPPAIDKIYSNTAHHFGEHLGWIQALVSGA